jgi:hypothetical protein
LVGDALQSVSIKLLNVARKSGKGCFNLMEGCALVKECELQRRIEEPSRPSGEDQTRTQRVSHSHSAALALDGGMDLLSQRWSALVQDGTKVRAIGQLLLNMEINVLVLGNDREAMNVWERHLHVLQWTRGDEQLDVQGCQLSDDVELNCGRGLVKGVKIVEGDHCVGELSQQTEELLFGWLRLLAEMPSIGLVEKGKAARMSLEGLLDEDLQK